MPGGPDEEAPGNHRGKREDSGGKPRPGAPQRFRDHPQHDEDEQRPGRPGSASVVLDVEITEGEEPAEENGQPARVDEKARCLPDRLDPADIHRGNRPPPVGRAAYAQRRRAQVEGRSLREGSHSAYASAGSEVSRSTLAP